MSKIARAVLSKRQDPYRCLLLGRVAWEIGTLVQRLGWQIAKGYRSRAGSFYLMLRLAPGVTGRTILACIRIADHELHRPSLYQNMPHTTWRLQRHYGKPLAWRRAWLLRLMRAAADGRAISQGRIHETW